VSVAGGLAGITRRLPVLAGVGLVAAAYATLAVHYHRTAMMAPDESFYTLAAREALEGRLPYRDFAYTQTPILPYLNGALLSLTGFTMDAHRAINAVWGLLGLGVLVAFVRHRLGRWEPAILAGFLLAASPRWMSLQAMAVWCGPAGAFLNVAMAAALWRGGIWRRVAIFAFAGTVAIGCRLSCAPVVAVLFAGLALDAGGARRVALALAACLAVGALALAPFIAAAPQNFFYHVWQYHMGAAFERNLQAQAMQWWTVSPAGISVLAGGLLGLARLVRAREWAAVVLLAAGVAGVVTPMIPGSAWGVYVAAGVPVGVAAGVVSFWCLGDERRSPLRHVAWALPALALVAYLPIEVPEGASTEVSQVARFLRSEVGEGPVLTPATIVAVEAGREVIPGTEMGTFSAMRPDAGEEARRRHMTTLPELARIVAAREPAAIVKTIEPAPWRVWNFRWVLPSLDDQPIDAIKLFEDQIEASYRPAMRTTTMEVFVPR